MPISRSIVIGLVAALVLGLCSGVWASPKVALVLGSGAARGFSHIGVIQAFEENGVPVDLLVGTSMGSIVAGLYAAGYSVENMRQLFTILDIPALVDIAIPPKGGLINSARLQLFLDTLLHNKTFDELEIPFIATMTNVRTGEPVAKNEGAVSTAVLASFAIPALFPPVEIDGQYYVDGGMKNLVPANIAREQGADVVVAVYVRKDTENVDFDNLFTNAQLTLQFMLTGYTEPNLSMADVVIIPEVEYDSYMDYQKADQFIEEGYLAGLAYMDGIMATILEHDPSFQFIPYSRKGFTPDEVMKINEKATVQAVNLPQPLRILPEITLDPLGEFPQFGLGIGRGPLSWFELGYRYGLDNENGGHELFLEWSKGRVGRVAGFARNSRGLANLTFGAAFDIDIAKNMELSGVYLTQGDIQWQLSGCIQDLLVIGPTSLSFGAAISRHRSDLHPLYASIHPELKLYSFAEHHPAFEVVLFRPYLYTRVDLTTPLAKWDGSLSYELGLGSEFKLFGMYPLELTIGYRIGDAQDNAWRFKICSGRF